MKAIKGKYYQIGENFAIKANQNLRIESNKEVKEHKSKTTLPKHLKDKLND